MQGGEKESKADDDMERGGKRNETDFQRNFSVRNTWCLRTCMQIYACICNNKFDRLYNYCS